MTPTMVILMSIASMATFIIISMPIIISSVNTAAIILDLAMLVATTMATIIGARGNDGGAASGLSGSWKAAASVPHRAAAIANCHVAGRRHFGRAAKASAAEPMGAPRAGSHPTVVVIACRRL
jgi:hypothetical protein